MKRQAALLIALGLTAGLWGIRQASRQPDLPFVAPRWGGWFEGDLPGIGTVSAHLDQREDQPVLSLEVLPADQQTWWLTGSQQGEQFHFQTPATGNEPALDLWLRREKDALIGSMRLSNNAPVDIQLRTVAGELEFTPPHRGWTFRGRGAQFTSRTRLPLLTNGPLARDVLNRLQQATRDQYATDLKEFQPGPITQLRAIWQGGSYERFDRDTTWRVAYADPRHISLICFDYVYSGGAHGNTDIQTATFVWRDERLQPVHLGDFFAGTDWTNTVVTLLQRELKQRGASWPDRKNILPVLNAGNCTYDPRGVTVYFAPYSVGSYAEGIYTVPLTWQQLRAVLRPDNPLGFPPP